MAISCNFSCAAEELMQKWVGVSDRWNYVHSIAAMRKLKQFIVFEASWKTIQSRRQKNLYLQEVDVVNGKKCKHSHKDHTLGFTIHIDKDLCKIIFFISERAESHSENVGRFIKVDICHTKPHHHSRQNIYTKLRGETIVRNSVQGKRTGRVCAGMCWGWQKVGRIPSISESIW